MRTIAAITLSLATALPAAAQPVMYSVLDLGVVPIGGAGGQQGMAINASGQTTGTAFVGGVRTAFRGSADGQITYLGAGYGYGINASGQVAGVLDGVGPVLTTASGDFSTATFLGGNSNNFAFGLNDIGQVVGNATLPGNSSFHAMRTTPGGAFDATADLGTLGGTQSTAFAINAAGQATGQFYLAGDTIIHTFRTTATGTLSTAVDLGTFGGSYSRGQAINASGQVAGYSFLAGDNSEHAFRLSGNGQPVSIQDLGTLGGSSSSAGGINALGVVVGDAVTAAGNTVGFVYDTSMHNLNTMVPAGWDITNAGAINDAGQIAASGSFQGGPVDGLVLTPMQVPEPSALALTALAGVWLGWRRMMGRRCARTVVEAVSVHGP